jgi:hypothetical protein
MTMSTSRRAPLTADKTGAMPSCGSVMSASRDVIEAEPEWWGDAWMTGVEPGSAG